MAERKVNIFKVLGYMDRGNFDAYRGLFSDEERKEVDGLLSYPALRWMSVAQDDTQHEGALQMVNEVANRGYFEFGKHRELQFKLLAVAGIRSFVKHGWIAAPPSKRSGKIYEMLRRAYPFMKDDEATLWVEVNSAEGVLELARRLGCDKDEMKALVEECKAL